jgi:hypothetical protein
MSACGYRTVRIDPIFGGMLLYNLVRHDNHVNRPKGYKALLQVLSVAKIGENNWLLGSNYCYISQKIEHTYV